jgi:hypothetical protein
MTLVLLPGGYSVASVTHQGAAKYLAQSSTVFSILYLCVCGGGVPA